MHLTTFASPNTAHDKSSANLAGAGSLSACAPGKESHVVLEGPRWEGRSTNEISERGKRLTLGR